MLCSGSLNVNAVSALISTRIVVAATPRSSSIYNPSHHILEDFSATKQGVSLSDDKRSMLVTLCILIGHTGVKDCKFAKSGGGVVCACVDASWVMVCGVAINGLHAPHDAWRVV